MPEATGRIHISLDPAVLDALRREAKDTGIPMSRIIVKAIEGRNRLAIVEMKGLSAAPAQQAEAQSISIRTKAGLAAAKRSGTLLGSARPGHWLGREQLRLDGLAKARIVAARLKRERAMEAIIDLKGHIMDLHDVGMTAIAIATQLNAEGHLTSSGSPWLEQSVRTAIKRFENAK
jgi:DNA invertase Pin-like site-specific DNA recombinase